MHTEKHLSRSLFCMTLQTWGPSTLLKKDSSACVFLWIFLKKKVRLNYATTHHDSPRPTMTHHDPPPSTTSQNMSTNTHHHPPPSTTTHRQPKSIYHHPPPAKIYPSPPTTTQNIHHFLEVDGGGWWHSLVWPFKKTYF